VIDPLRLLGPLFLALLAAVGVEQLTRARGLEAPGFRDPARRALGLGVMTAVLWLTVFVGLGQVGLPAADVQSVPIPALFTGHAILVAGLLAWFLLGHAGWVEPEPPLGQVLREQVGLASRAPWREVGLGLGLGLIAWPVVLGALLVLGFSLLALGGGELVPQQPPPLIVWLAGLPVAVKLAVALSAGVVEELFFRGFLQPRVGIAFSTLLFVLAHLTYDQPLLLVGVTLLSLFFAGLVAWRQNIWAAMVAHALFDAGQLLFLIPWALRQGAEAATTVAGALPAG
jgi:membrane protease YdiL (CAAX protease family)